MIMKKKNFLIAGATLVEILIAIVIASVMMMALFTSYNVVNKSYTQVSDRASISRVNRNIISMLLKDIRMAGFYDVNAQKFSSPELQPILIIKNNTNCDKIVIVYGDRVKVGSTIEFPLYQVTYECKNSKIPDRKATPNNSGVYPPLSLKAIYKTKKKWNESNKNWNDASTDGDSNTYLANIVVDYVEDLIFNPIDENGKIISPIPSNTENSEMLSKIKAVDIGLILRSTDEFYKNEKNRTAFSLSEKDNKNQSGNRNKVVNDKFLRDTIIVTAYARNVQQN
tara:strand:+ start:552 stop:1397 length:846 start_codon:yes stop_codon:yes gene_type:complete